MTRRQQWLLVAGIVAITIVGVTAATMLLDENLYSGGKPGSRAPEFAAVTLGEPPESRTLADYRGRVVLLNIWATFCEPCKIEMPSLEKLHRELGPRGLSIVAVSVDAPNFENTIRKFVTDLNLTFDILYEPTGAIQTAYHSFGYPETFIIDRKGTITRLVWGFRPNIDDWTSPANIALLTRLLNEGTDPIPPPPKSAAIIASPPIGEAGGPRWP